MEWIQAKCKRRQGLKCETTTKGAGDAAKRVVRRAARRRAYLRAAHPADVSAAAEQRPVAPDSNGRVVTGRKQGGRPLFPRYATLAAVLTLQGWAIG